MLVLTVIAWVGVFIRRLYMMKRKPTYAFVFGRGRVAVSTLTTEEQAYVFANPGDAFDLSQFDKAQTVASAPAAAATAPSGTQA